jgi:hypothetical protein
MPTCLTSGIGSVSRATCAGATAGAGAGVFLLTAFAEAFFGVVFFGMNVPLTV